MQAADNMKLCDRLRIAGSCGLERFFQRHGIGPRSVFFTSKSAQAARRYADIRGIDVPVYVEISDVPAQAVTNMIGQPANGKYVRGTIERDGVVKSKALAGKDFGSNGLKARVVCLEPVPVWSQRARRHNEIIPCCENGFNFERRVVLPRGFRKEENRYSSMVGCDCGDLIRIQQ